MEPEFWHEAWRAGRIGFHQGRPNEFLVHHLDRLGPPGRILVPLAGKSHDLIHLASKGHQVFGVELSPAAVASFFEEHQLTPERSRLGPFEAWRAGPIALLVGDFFDLEREHLGDEPLTALYDRAAVVALPPEPRARYVTRLRALLPAGAVGLIVSFEYPPDAMEGPPFSVGVEALRALYAGLPLEELEDKDAEHPRLTEAGVTPRSRCFYVTF